jgi:hypothetical protein
VKLTAPRCVEDNPGLLAALKALWPRILTGGLTLAAFLALLAFAAAPASAAPWSGLLHPKKPVGPEEGVWALPGPGTRQIFINEGKSPVQVLAYVCVEAKAHGQSMVEVELAGHAPLEVAAGCQSVYLVVDSGEKVMLVNPGPDAASGSYRIARQG